MPKGIPTPQELVDGEVTFFSLDTDVIQSASYNFEKGALNQLPRQLPHSMSLKLTEVVLREIVGHRMKPVKAASEKYQAATTALERLIALDFSPARNHFDQLDVLNAATQRFDNEVRSYVGQCRGEVLQVADIDSELLFKRYFATSPPFGLKTDKKSEFPDAAALQLLEEHAKSLGTRAIVASMDGGWKAFSEQSEHLYCVASLDELATLFAATDIHAQAVKAKIAEAVSDEDSAVRMQLTDALHEHIANANWGAEELYSGSHRFEAETNSAELASYTVDEASLNIWKVDDEPGAWVVELAATVQVDVCVDVEFFVWDSIDREELAMGGQQLNFSEEVEVEVYLTCRDVKIDTDPESWETEVETGSGNYSLEPAEIELDLSGDD
ncbi:PIN domain-containing protein [Zoogloea sp.]|uniref:PIN domain-containing protein n=1 Tax=Zoogloea sp. TaxID=49181 RepID=UPI002FE131B1